MFARHTGPFLTRQPRPRPSSCSVPFIPAVGGARVSSASSPTTLHRRVARCSGPLRSNRRLPDRECPGRTVRTRRRCPLQGHGAVERPRRNAAKRHRHSHERLRETRARLHRHDPFQPRTTQTRAFPRTTRSPPPTTAHTRSRASRSTRPPERHDSHRDRHGSTRDHGLANGRDQRWAGNQLLIGGNKYIHHAGRAARGQPSVVTRHSGGCRRERRDQLYGNRALQLERPRRDASGWPRTRSLPPTQANIRLPPPNSC